MKMKIFFAVVLQHRCGNESALFRSNSLQSTKWQLFLSKHLNPEKIENFHQLYFIAH